MAVQKSQLFRHHREENGQVCSGSEKHSSLATDMIPAEFLGSSNGRGDEVRKEMEGFITELRTSLDSVNDFLLDNGDLDLFNVDNCDLLEKDLSEEDASLLAEVSEFEKEQVDANIPDITDSDLSKFSDFNKKEKVSSDDELTNGKRKVKIDWTPDLHRCFVQAVEQLGVDKAVPLKILNLMGVNCLTRHNIASHLQRYRSCKKRLLAREEETTSWSQKRQLYATTEGTRPIRELTPCLTNGGSSVIQPSPPIAYPPMQPAGHAPPFRHLHVWGHPTLNTSTLHMWQKQPSPAADGSFWQHQPPRLPLASVLGVPNFSPPVFSGDHYRPEDSNSAIHPPKETVDAAIDEVLSNRGAPLPIGLKAPSWESVMTELQKRGISIVTSASTCLAR